MTLDHFVLTRFNLPTGGVEARIRASESWLTNRWALFEHYCAPSVEAQTTKEFAWVIYFDPESPQWLREAIAPYAERGLFIPIFRAEAPRDILVSDLRRFARHGDGTLLTTNLDNDDGVAVDFLERLQAAVTFEDRRALYVTNGIIKGPDGVYVRHDPENAFCSVAEPWSDPRTSWDDWHIMLGRSMPVVEIDGAPGWLQVVHGENVSNRVRGRLVSPTAWSALFPGLLDDVAEPGRARMFRDRFLAGPVRWLRDTGRAMLRRVAIAVLGKDGMQNLKARLRH
ncbi:MAG: glycosyltransferase [Mycetocola sp.]